MYSSLGGKTFHEIAEVDKMGHFLIVIHELLKVQPEW